MPRALLIFCILSTLSFAQDAATGALHGTVLDPSGSRIPQTSIVAVNSATGARYSATSDAESRFSLDISLPATTPPAPSLKACRRKSVRHFTSKSAPPPNSSSISPSPALRKKLPSLLNSSTPIPLQLGYSFNLFNHDNQRVTITTNGLTAEATTFTPYTTYVTESPT
ncbi:MAG: carboxypeptidase-like regulatory domain-containing protein, partial [Candidatus Sulfotelmatobacter sp.]